MPDVLTSGTATTRTAPSDLASQPQPTIKSSYMPSTSTRCVHPSTMVISENIVACPWRPPLDVQHTCMPSSIAVIARKAGLIRHPQIGLVGVLQALIVHPVCFLGYEGQQGSGPERPVSGGCSGGAGGFGAVHSPEFAYSHSATQGLKRKRGGRGPSQPSKPASTKQSTPNFACHFYLHDRIGHSDCLDISLKRISDVRQHLLERAHYQVAYCPICGTTFPGRPAEARPQRDAHIQAATCERSQTLPDYPGITEDQDRRIRAIAHTSRGNQHSQVRRWYDIWDCLFPGEAHPPSPFLDDLPEIQRMVDWRNVIFDNGSHLWRELPAAPWTEAMGLEEQRAGMSDFIGSFILISRRLARHHSSPAEESHAVDVSSYMDVNTPAPSSASANAGLLSSVVDSRREFLSPTYATGRQYSQRFGRATPSLVGDLHAPVPPQAQAYPTADVPQEMPQDAPQEAQQPAAAGEDTTLQDTIYDDSLVDFLTWETFQGSD